MSLERLELPGSFERVALNYQGIYRDSKQEQSPWGQDWNTVGERSLIVIQGAASASLHQLPALTQVWTVPYNRV